MSENYAFPDCLMLFRRDREMTQGDHFCHDPSDWHCYVRADLHEAAEAEVARLRDALQNIADSYEATSELHTSSADCAANLYDHARAAITTKGDTP